jgi:hypothetical protein
MLRRADRTANRDETMTGDDLKEMRPLCFVLMPFGRKTDAAGRTTDFDAVYQAIIAPAVEQAGLEPIRADEEKIGGAIHKPMFERLMLCNYAVADITGANPNVYYELGIRHAMRPRSTVILFAAGTTLPFDIALLRGIPYQTNEQGVPSNPASCVAAIATQLKAAKESPHDDSPLFQLLDYMPRNEVDHTKTDTFRDTFNYSKKHKQRLADALRQGEQAVKEAVADPAFKNLHDVETGVIVDMFLTLRDVKAHKEMIELFQRMPEPLQRARIVREQYAFALNREGRAQEAIDVLKAVIAESGPSSETNGLLGRVYKDQWEAAKKSGSGGLQVRGLLKLAAETYLAGFQADWRDAYPGINAVTLMELMDKPPPIQTEILPVVRFSAAQKAKANGDYWDFATLMELAVLARDEDAAMEQTETMLAKAQFGWHLETTERNLRLIREARAARGEELPWIKELEDALAEKRAQMPAQQ